MWTDEFLQKALAPEVTSGRILQLYQRINAKRHPMKLSKKLVVPGGVAGALVVACAACCAPLIAPVVAVLGTAALGVVALRRRYGAGKLAHAAPCQAACANVEESQCRSRT
jgi:hypothetical protein